MKNKDSMNILFIFLVLFSLGSSETGYLIGVTLLSQIQAIYLVQEAEEKLRYGNKLGATSYLWRVLILFPSNALALAYLGLLCPDITRKMIPQRSSFGKKNLDFPSQLERISKLPLPMRQYTEANIQEDDKGRYLFIFSEEIKVYEVDWDKANLIKIDSTFEERKNSEKRSEDN